MHIGLPQLHLTTSSPHSLKEKRNYFKSLIHRLHKDFNISIAELGKSDFL